MFYRKLIGLENNVKNYIGLIRDWWMEFIFKLLKDKLFIRIFI